VDAALEEVKAGAEFSQLQAVTRVQRRGVNTSWGKGALWGNGESIAEWAHRTCQRIEGITAATVLEARRVLTQSRS
jgi:hypothetical protein